jgi:hypothetical protein|tara:strand:+ start:2081 stop:2536 length:456 start_codon:yes stop_codon:yes gene_type:complete
MVEIVKMESSGLHKLAPVVHVIKRKDEGEDKDLDYHMVLLPGTQIVLILFENTHYHEDVDTVSNGDTTYYKTITSIPKYGVHKNNKKVSSALPRLDMHEQPFLFIPKGHKRMGKINRNALQRNYYIFSLDDEYHITEKSSLFFNVKGGLYD